MLGELRENFIYLYCTSNVMTAGSEKFEDAKGIIRSRKSKKDRQYNGQNDKQ
jgi:hypothetical protein